MTAKEMFEELGYVYHKKEDYPFVEYCGTNPIIFDNRHYRIEFYDHAYSIVNTFTSAPPFISQELHKAINQQLEELGWL